MPDAVVESPAQPDTASADEAASVDRGRPEVVVKHRGFLRRWASRLMALLIAVVALMVLVGLVVTVVLRSDLPRSIAESTATSVLNLDVSIGGLAVGWMGGVEIRELAVRLPEPDGDEGPLVAEVPRVEAKLSPLPLLVLNVLAGGNPLPDSITVESPTIYLTQADDGTWTLPRAARLAGSGGGANDPDSAGGRISLPDLPDLLVTDGTLVVRDNTGNTRRAEGLAVSVTHPTPLALHASVTLPEHLTLEARLLPAGGPDHRIALTATGFDDLLAPFLAGLPTHEINATWDGTFADDGGIEGTLRLAAGSSVMDYGLAGDVRVDAGAGVVVRPDGLTATNLPTVGEVTVRGGVLRAGIAGQAPVVADHVLVETLDGRVLLREAAFDPAALTGSAAVSFEDVVLPGGGPTSGDATARLWLTPFGRVRATGELSAQGELAGRRVERFAAEFDAQGLAFRSFETMDVRFSLPERAVIADGQGQTELPEVDGLVQIRLADERPHLALARLTTPTAQGELSATGRFNLPQSDSPADYELAVSASGWPVALPRMAEPLPLSLEFSAGGELAEGQNAVQIRELSGRYGDLLLAGRGRYRIGVPPADFVGPMLPPLALEVIVTRSELASRLTPEPVVLPTDTAAVDLLPDREIDPDTIEVRDRPDAAVPPAEATRPTGVLRGDIRAVLGLLGDPAAGLFLATGDLATRDFGIGDYELGDLQTEIEATVIADRLRIRTRRDTELLGATIRRLSANIPFDDTKAGRIDLRFEGLSLARVVEAAALSGLDGTTGVADADLRLRLRGFSPERMELDGLIEARDVALASGLVAERATLAPRLERGRLEVPIVLSNPATLPGTPTVLEAFDERARIAIESVAVAEPAQEGTLRLVLSTDLTDPSRLVIDDLSASEYPLVIEPSMTGDGRAVAVEVTTRSERIVIVTGGDPEQDAPPLDIRGDVDALLRVFVGESPETLETVLSLDVGLDANRGAIELSRLAGRFPSAGTIAGGGRLNLEDPPGRSDVWVHSTLELGPLLDKLRVGSSGRGRLDLALSVRPVPVERPKGEILVDLSFSGQEASVDGVPIDRGQVLAYLSRAILPDGTPPAGPYDITLISTERIRLLAAGGVTEAYFKLRKRGDVGGTQVQVTLDTVDVQAAPLAALADVEVEGDITISTTVNGPLETDLVALNGQGRFDLVDGELARFNVINRILEQVDFIPIDIRDEAEFNYRFEQGDLVVRGARVFVDGVEIRGNFRVFGLVGETTSPRIEGQVLVLLQPLSAFQLPLFAQATEVLNAIQANATAFRLGGTLEEPVVRQVLLEEFGGTLGSILGIGR
jgi:hypothetical protein